MGKRMGAVLTVLAVVAVAVPAMIVWGAEGGAGERERREPERAVQPAPDRPAGPAEMEAKTRMLRERVETLRRLAEGLDQQGMPEMAREVRARAEQTQKELNGLMEAMPRREGMERREGPPPERAAADLGEVARRQAQMIERMMAEQEKLRAQVTELTERVNTLQKDVAGLRERLPR